MLLTRFSNSDLEQLLLIRHFEEALLDLFAQGKLNGTTHTCLGQEYIPVALKSLLTDDDFVFSNHRGHGHYLARFDDPVGLLAEIMGRSGGVCNGVGGSQHIYKENYLSTGVQGESLPVAVGVALHLKREGIQGLAAVYIGDGTWGEGAVYEAINMAQLWQVPLLVLVENNKIAQSTPITLQMAGTVEGRAQAFGIPYYKITSIDINTIRNELCPVILQSRSLPCPVIVEFDTYRVGPHSKGDDTRDDNLIRSVHENDWYLLYQEQFPDQFAPLDKLTRKKIEDVIEKVEAQPLSAWEPV